MILRRQVLIFSALYSLLLVEISSYAQVYRSLPDSNVSWLIRFVPPSPDNSTNYRRIFSQKYKKVIQFNSKEYIELSEESFLNGIYYPPKLFGGYRSLSDGKTYFLSADSSQEYLLSDISKQKGDTVFNVYANSKLL